MISRRKRKALHRLHANRRSVCTVSWKRPLRGIPRRHALFPSQLKSPHVQTASRPGAARWPRACWNPDYQIAMGLVALTIRLAQLQGRSTVFARASKTFFHFPQHFQCEFTSFGVVTWTARLAVRSPWRSRAARAAPRPWPSRLMRRSLHSKL